jgi:hypothetical protein
VPDDSFLLKPSDHWHSDTVECSMSALPHGTWWPSCLPSCHKTFVHTLYQIVIQSSLRNNNIIYVLSQLLFFFINSLTANGVLTACPQYNYNLMHEQALTFQSYTWSSSDYWNHLQTSCRWPLKWKQFANLKRTLRLEERVCMDL